MTALTPNGDIVKRQRVDPLTVASREGICEVARGIALRMAWNKPDAYEKSKQGDWSFVGWDSTPFATQYNITWTKDDNESPLMFAAVRILIDDWYRRLLGRSERYVGWRRYFSPTTSRDDEFPFGGFSSDDPAPGEMFSWVAMGLVGYAGGWLDPFLPEREEDLDIDCGRNAIISAARMIDGIGGDPGRQYRGNLQSVCEDNYDGDENVGDASYKRFKSNPLTLDDDWEVGMAALVGMFDRCYWAMMDGYGELAHPPVRVVHLTRDYEVELGLSWEIKEGEGGAKYIEATPSYNRTSVASEEVVSVAGETEDIVLTMSASEYRGAVAAVINESYHEAPETEEREGHSSVGYMVVNGIGMFDAFYVKRKPDVSIETNPYVRRPTFSSTCAVSVGIDESFDRQDDHKSERTWIFERYDFDYEGGYHHGEVREQANDMTLGDIYSEYLSRFRERIPTRIPFSPITATYDGGEMAPVTIDISGDYVIDIYDYGGNYFGTVSGVDELHYGGVYDASDRRDAFSESKEVSATIESGFDVSGPIREGDFKLVVKNAIIGRSDIHL